MSIMSSGPQTGSQKSDPYQSPQTDVSLASGDKKKVVSERPDDGNLGGIVSLKVAFFRASIASLVAGAIIMTRSYGFNDTWVGILGFVVFAIWASTIVVLMIAVVNRFIKWSR